MTATYKKYKREISKKCYGWSKWGGARMGLVKETLSTWYCQICGEKQTNECPAFMWEIDNNEFLRICSNCYVISKTNDMLDEIRIRSKNLTNVDNLELNGFKLTYVRKYTHTSFVTLPRLD